MTTKTVYIAKDGAEFERRDICLKYEEELHNAAIGEAYNKVIFPVRYDREMTVREFLDAVPDDEIIELASFEDYVGEKYGALDLLDFFWKHRYEATPESLIQTIIRAWKDEQALCIAEGDEYEADMWDIKYLKED